MDVSTASGSDSDANEILSAPRTDNNIHIKNVPAFVVWRNLHGENRSLPNLGLSLLYTSTSGASKALVQLQATTRLKKGPAKPNIYLFVKPDQICNLAYIGSEGDLDHDQEELHRQAREKLGTSTHVLRFELRSAPSFIVPNEHPFNCFRAGSQVVWASLRDFARDARCFVLHFPTTTLSKARILSFCQAASSDGTLVSLNDNIPSLYGGKGGKAVDVLTYDEDDADPAKARGQFATDDNTAPPAYEERTSAGPSLYTREPPLCLSPGPSVRRLRKRRREYSSSGSDCEGTTSYEKGTKASDKILRAIFGLHRIVNEANAAHEASISKIIAKVEKIEGRFKQLEEDQRNLADEVRTSMAPLWDEMDARLQSQEDREHVHMRDVIEEVVDENIKEKMAEAINEYFNNDDEGQELIHKTISESVREETTEYLQNQRFTGHFTITQETALI
ncbi:hypothetical protein ONZ43_g3613 [Nemania bipapillata]|uniref:Uncharacterized protein n=1 Tax=Nemania bipapillata TaxID=110536 RepID=A0ACC2IW37_9PEZI|nr:hypothetical protein ONZ43_g3613 [Nemania bipapillata]